MAMDGVRNEEGQGMVHGVPQTCPTTPGSAGTQGHNRGSGRAKPLPYKDKRRANSSSKLVVRVRFSSPAPRMSAQSHPRVRAVEGRYQQLPLAMSCPAIGLVLGNLWRQDVNQTGRKRPLVGEPNGRSMWRPTSSTSNS